MSKQPEVKVDYGELAAAASAMEEDIKLLNKLCQEITSDERVNLHSSWKGRAKNRYDNELMTVVSTFRQVSKSLQTLNGKLKKAAQTYRQGDEEVIDLTIRSGFGGGGGGGGRF